MALEASFDDIYGDRPRRRTAGGGDPTTAFRDAIAAAGLMPPAEIIGDGKIHKFASDGRRGDKAGWYTLFSDDPVSGAFGCWRSGINEKWSAGINGHQMTPAQQEEFRRRVKAAKAARDAEEEQVRADCRRESEATWKKLPPVEPDHPYLDRKGIRPHGARRFGDKIVIPVRDIDGGLHGLQQITPSGGKVFKLGTAVSGHLYMLGDPGDVIIVAEGFATAASLRQATDHTVVLAFNAGNLQPVAEVLRKRFPTARIVIAGDNDDSGVGQEKALAAAAAVGGVTVIPEETGTDFNDVQVADGLDAVRDAIEAALANGTFGTFGTFGTNGTDHTDAEQSAWSDPDITLLGTGRRPAPELPVALFGDFWSAWIARKAAHTSAPADYVALGLLSCAGAMLANVRWPLAGASWSEPTVLWVGLVGGPSAGKSPAMDAGFDLVRHAEQLLAENFDAELIAHKTAKQIAKAKAAEWEASVSAAIKAGETPPTMPADCDVPEAPTRPRVLVNDATTEKLAALAAALPRGLLQWRDELSGWLAGFGRYSGSGADRAFAVEMYGGRGYTIDRVKDATPVRITSLSIGVLGGIQPDKLTAVLDGPDDGLVARFLWTWPDAEPGFILAREIDRDDAAKAAFIHLASLRMGADDDGQPRPIKIRLAPDAEDVIEDFGQEMACRAAGASGLLGGALGKARGHALRLALILEYLEWSGTAATGSVFKAPPPEPTTVSKQAVLSACGLLDGYLLPMAERAFGDAAIPTSERQAIMLARHLRRHRISRFNARDLRRQIGGPLREAKEMNAACEMLIEAGLIRAADKGQRVGRRPLDYDVNPVVITEAAS